MKRQHGQGGLGSCIEESASAPIGRLASMAELGEFFGFRAYVIPPSDRHKSTGLVNRAIELELATMIALGDRSVEADIEHTIEVSSFVFLFRADDASCDPSAMVGAVRFMVGTDRGVKTLWDLQHLANGVEWFSDAVANPARLVDAMSLAPAMDSGVNIADLTDALLGVSRCIGGGAAPSRPMRSCDRLYARHLPPACLPNRLSL